MATPLWLLPPGFNASENEGREAFQNGQDIEACRYGDSLAGEDWRRGWKAAAVKAKAAIQALLAAPKFDAVDPTAIL